MTKDEVKTKAEWISTFYFGKCWKCDIDFASPLLNKRLVDGEEFFCPLGHVNVFKEAFEEKENRERESLRKFEEEEKFYRMMHPKPELPPVATESKSFWKRNKK